MARGENFWCLMPLSTLLNLYHGRYDSEPTFGGMTLLRCGRSTILTHSFRNNNSIVPWYESGEAAGRHTILIPLFSGLYPIVFWKSQGAAGSLAV